MEVELQTQRTDGVRNLCLRDSMSWTRHWQVLIRFRDRAPQSPCCSFFCELPVPNFWLTMPFFLRTIVHCEPLALHLKFQSIHHHKSTVCTLDFKLVILSFLPTFWPRRQYRLNNMEQHTLEPELPLPPYPEPGVSSYEELSYDYPPPPSLYEKPSEEYSSPTSPNIHCRIISVYRGNVI